uniref:AAA+ ATPase domain-containing protein n=1 Tax=Paramoeba aestuarina TaxID=180227 RepID=A0A7S4KTG7_9EUKA
MGSPTDDDVEMGDSFLDSSQESQGDKGKEKEGGGKVKAVASKDSIWVEKYRPSSLDDIISHKHILSTLDSLINQKKLPHMLFYGPPGTGKTSTILAVARNLFGPKFRSLILELNASDDRGIDVVREKIKSFAGTRKIFSSGVKLIILDEADSMTKDAQAALRRVIEKYTKSTRFCLICNYVNKIIPAIQSRCTKFRFAPLKQEQIVPRLNYIVREEKVEITDGGMEGLLRLGQGDMRKCVNILQATHMAYSKVDEEAVYKCTGNPLPEIIRRIVEILLNEEFSGAYQEILAIKTGAGIALTDILSEVFFYVQTLSFPPKVRMKLYDSLATIEHRQSVGTTEHLQLAALVAAFQHAREETEVFLAMKED